LLIVLLVFDPETAQSAKEQVLEPREFVLLFFYFETLAELLVGVGVAC
jgi:hypothetical protein